MPKKLYSLTVRGRTKTWSFETYVDPKYVLGWQLDGIDIKEIINVIPEWYVDLGLPVRLWCFVQDIINLRNPFAGI